MWKKIEFAIVLLLLAVLIMMSNHLEEMVSSGRVTGRNPCIVLDSGHGGEDPGKIGVNQAKEKDVNLKIAKKTKERLEKKGWKVVMTREKDVMLGDPAAGNKKIHDMKARVNGSIRRCRRLRSVSIRTAIRMRRSTGRRSSIIHIRKRESEWPK